MPRGGARPGAGRKPNGHSAAAAASAAATAVNSEAAVRKATGTSLRRGAKIKRPTNVALGRIRSRSHARGLPAVMIEHQWKPGQSGNPAGFSAYSHVMRLAKEYSVEAIHELGALIYSEDDRVAVVACQAILDRAHGRVKVAEDPPTEREELEAMSPEERRAEMQRLVDKARGVLAEGPIIEGEASDE